MSTATLTLVSVADVALACKVSRRAVLRWCAEGRIKARRTPGGEWRVYVGADQWPVEA